MPAGTELLMDFPLYGMPRLIVCSIQPTFSCSKSTIKTREQYVKPVQGSIVDFKNK